MLPYDVSPTSPSGVGPKFHNTDSLRCLCGTQFCYVCGAIWKNCACPQWDERRLLARAEVIVDRQPREMELALAHHAEQVRQATERRAEQVRQAMERLREDHECAHDEGWRKVTTGSLRCEECTHTLGAFLLECRQCNLRACVRCKQNRL